MKTLHLLGGPRHDHCIEIQAGNEVRVIEHEPEPWKSMLRGDDPDVEPFDEPRITTYHGSGLLDPDGFEYAGVAGYPVQLLHGSMTITALQARLLPDGLDRAEESLRHRLHAAAVAHGLTLVVGQTEIVRATNMAQEVHELTGRAIGYRA